MLMMGVLFWSRVGVILVVYPEMVMAHGLVVLVATR